MDRRPAPPNRLADALARLYDLDLVEDPGDLDLYLALAARTGGPILELAAGTGRLAVPLAAAGHRRHRRRHRPGDARRGSRRRAAAAGAADRRAARARRGRPARPAISRPPARRPGVHRPELAVPARDPRRPARRRSATMARHLAPGGLAVVDVWLPDADDLARFDGRLILEYVRRRSRDRPQVTKVAAAQHDAATGDRQPDHDLRGGRPGEPAARWIRARRAPARRRRTSCATSPRRPGSRSRPSPATTTWSRSGRAATGRSSSRAALTPASRRGPDHPAGAAGTSGEPGRRPSALVHSARWHPVIRRACCSSRTSRRSRSTSAAC